MFRLRLEVHEVLLEVFRLRLEVNEVWPSRGLIILLYRLGPSRGTSVGQLDLQNFSPTLFPARCLPRQLAPSLHC